MHMVSDCALCLEWRLDFPEDLKFKNQWYCDHGQLGTVESGQGDVFRIRRKSGQSKKAALKIYKGLEKQIKRGRCYRETEALRATKNGKEIILDLTWVRRIGDFEKSIYQSSR